MKQVVLITGGTSGIGLGLAKAFMNRGDFVVVCGRSREGLEQFSRVYSGALAIKADVTIAEERTAMLEMVTRKYGQLDILVNNAGTFIERNFAVDQDATTGLEQEVAPNLTAPIQLRKC